MIFFFWEEVPYLYSKGVRVVSLFDDTEYLYTCTSITSDYMEKYMVVLATFAQCFSYLVMNMLH